MNATETPIRSSVPKNYRLVCDVVKEGGLGRHLTMSDAFRRATFKRSGIGFSTVYRGLGRLRDLGLIVEIVVPGADSATYEPPGPQHAHFHCKQCGTIEDIACALPARILGDIALDTGFAVETGNVTFAGRCRVCQTS